MAVFEGFPKGAKSLPVPSQLLGSLLEQIDDMAELKCTLRFLWHAAHVPGSPKWVAAEVLERDGTLLRALGSTEEVRRGVSAAVDRGTLLSAGGRLLLGTPENARAAARLTSPAATPAPAEPWPMRRQANVFVLYEENIGLLTPMVADQLRDAEETYPVEWIEAAIREAAERNVRAWRYIAAILERWAADGRGDDGKRGHERRGKSGRHPQTITAAEYLRKRRAAG